MDGWMDVWMDVWMHVCNWFCAYRFMYMSGFLLDLHRDEKKLLLLLGHH